MMDPRFDLFPLADAQPVALFLLALADLVDRMIADRTAVFVTPGTSAQLRMIALFPWTECAIVFGSDGPDELHGQARPVSLSDLALGWLLASKPAPYAPAADLLSDGLDYAMERAAVSAELAILSRRVLIPHHEELAPRPHDGSVNGARAAWEFIVMQLRKHTLPTGTPTDLARDQILADLTEVYQRQLEAIPRTLGDR